jgi:ABC1 atypical kinase-like domain
MNSISTLFRGPRLHVFAVAFVLLVLYNGCSSIGTLVTGFSLGYQQTATWHSRQHQPHYSRTLKRIQATGTSTPSDMRSAKKKDKNDGLRLIDDEDDDDVEFPPPLSGYDRLKRAATFWSTALPIVASYYGLISQIKLRELLAGGEALPEEQVRALWDAQHQDGATKLADTITHLKGFYVKTAQIISSRQDLFPSQYTDALAGFTDNLDPMPVSLAKKVIESELLTGRGDDESFADVFSEFDEIPLGAASVAQVHRAVLTAKYGGPRVVAVKIQRPSIESKLMGDVANLKAIAKTFRDTPTLPLDYYTVFCELEKQLADEFDFVKEAVAMDRIYQSLIRAPNGSLRDMPLVMPRPVPGLISRRVLVMDYLDGVPLSRSREEMIKKGIDPDSPEAKLFGKKLLDALTEAFGRNILETGFFHADPHPGVSTKNLCIPFVASRSVSSAAAHGANTNSPACLFISCTCQYRTFLYCLMADPV